MVMATEWRHGPGNNFENSLLVQYDTIRSPCPPTQPSNCEQWIDAISLILLTAFVLRQQFQFPPFSSFPSSSGFSNRTVYFLTYWALTFGYFMFFPFVVLHFHIDRKIEIRQTFVLVLCAHSMCMRVWTRIVSVDGSDIIESITSTTTTSKTQKKVIYLFKWPNAFIVPTKESKQK